MKNIILVGIMGCGKTTISKLLSEKLKMPVIDMDEYIEKHLIDVLNAINEVESFFADRPKLFQEFQNDMLRQRAVERNIEIMGEAINRILKANPEFQLPNAKAIINTRNRVIHGYDSVTTEFLWSLIMKHIPALKNDVENILTNK